MVIFKATLFEMDCSEHQSERQKIQLQPYQILSGKYVQCTSTPGLWKSTLSSLISLAVVMSCLKESTSHMGPLYWFPGQMLPNSRTLNLQHQSFLHTTLRKRRKKSKHPNCPVPPRGVYVVVFFKGKSMRKTKEYKTRDKIFKVK